MPAKKNPDASPALTNPLFTDADKAREHLEALRWPDGPYCPHCGEADAENITRMDGEAHRKGLLQCKSCRKQFSVTVGTLFERSHIPLNKWLCAFHLMASSKKGMSAHQMHRLLDITYKSAWFMAHRIREAMNETPSGPLGGKGKKVEADETYWGQKEGVPKKKGGGSHKMAIMALVERGGRSRGFHVPRPSREVIRNVLADNIDLKSHLMTDDARHYQKTGRMFTAHSSVNHTRKEYVRGTAHTNTIEGYFSLLKRGLIGTFHHVGEQHLQRYVNEFDFRYNNRKVWDDELEKMRPMFDAERTLIALRGITGKRLTYRRSDNALTA